MRTRPGSTNSGCLDLEIFVSVVVATSQRDLQNTYARGRNDFKTPPPVERHEDIEIDQKEGLSRCFSHSAHRGGVDNIIGRAYTHPPMAKKRSRQSKIEPSELTLRFNTPAAAGGTTVTSYIDLSQVASLVNRRFYRQGLNWAVAGFKIFNPPVPAGGSIEASVLCSKLPNSWIMSNAWEKSMRTWLKMSNEALKESESARPRFMDFKIFADAAHHQAGTAGNLLPLNEGGTASPGEWDYSTIRVPDSAKVDPASVGFDIEREVNTFDLIATGANYPGVSPVTGNDAVSLIEGYAASRALPALVDPNTPSDMEDADGSTPENWMTAIFNEGLVQESEVLEDLRDQNIIAPYPFEGSPGKTDTQYPGGANQLSGLMVHDQTNITTTTIGGNSYLKGGNFPCGLIKITHLNQPGSFTHGLTIQVDLVPGGHRGYLCEAMTEM